MKKIPSVFQRNYDGDRLIRDEVVPGCEWVLAGEGAATVKWDGTAVLIQDGKAYKRYDAKRGRTPPADFIPAQPEPDPVSGHWPGWVPVTDADKWHNEAIGQWKALLFRDSNHETYELIGPKVQNNPHRYAYHELMRHGSVHFIEADAPRTFASIRSMLVANPDAEGVVFWRGNGDMAKVKRKDYGLPWPPVEALP